MSGYCDSNTGPSGPKPDALANCATPRVMFLPKRTAKVCCFSHISKFLTENYINFVKNLEKTMIEASGIEKSFGQLKVLKGVDIVVNKGEVVSIVGASGAGKSTFLQILGTLLTPDKGSVSINGKNLSGLSSGQLADFRNREIGFVFQAHHLLPEFTAKENVMMPALIAGETFASSSRRALRLLDEVGLAERALHKPSELSGGEQQRVAVARAIMNNPSVLFADEPSGNLDSRTKEEIHGLFFKLREHYGQTILIVTHDSGLAAMCDRALEMKDGKFV